jgi:ppGpp synthetase/RelA/SpoT-type nucleotidyltranferase
MKISASIRNAYFIQHQLNLALEKRVSEVMLGKKKAHWFYNSRVKSLESFAQKLETGRFNPHRLEDFFACTLVVENKTAIFDAIELIKTYCVIQYQRPKSFSETHKQPEVFSFDDLRLYVTMANLDIAPRTPLNEIVFEVQIKTFLQHAWSIATHDLIYKGDSISWSKARLAFQIKAMLEHAEVSIEQVNSISSSTSLAMSDPKTQALIEVLTWLKATWKEELLPKNIVRLAETVNDLMTFFELKLADLIDALEKDTLAGYGKAIINLAPYEIIIKSLFNQKQNNVLQALNNKNRQFNKRLFITPEMELDNFINQIPGYRITGPNSNPEHVI